VITNLTRMLIIHVIHDPTEIMQHFKILVTRFSARILWRTGVLTETVTFEISQNGALGN